MSSPVDGTIPGWFADAIATPYEVSEVQVAGAVVRSRCWGPPGRGIVLVHGGAANASWWDHIAPLLAQDWRVIAVDLSGHGASAWRAEGYALAKWAEEVVEQAGPAGITDRPYLVGHSMGGYVAITAGAEFRDRVAGIIAIDSFLPPPTPEVAARHIPPRIADTRYYRTREEAIERFKLLPADPYTLPYVVRHVAEESVGHDEPGWFWRYDPNTRRIDRLISSETVTRAHARLALVRAEFGIVGQVDDGGAITVADRQVPTVRVPRTGHHVILDDPLTVARDVRRILTEWERERTTQPTGENTDVSGDP